MAGLRTSTAGIAFVERHEGVVLRAYRCPAGKWTIGPGLTAASGVIKPKAGMTITRKEASALLVKALVKYEGRVARAMPGAVQREFDAGVSFDYNTGAIGRASWVRAWIKRDWTDTERRLKLWSKGGGRRLPGLVRRRDEEFALLRFGHYGEKGQVVGGARITIPLTQAEIYDAKTELEALGYTLTHAGIRSFQRDHDLTADGIVGRATLSTLQRRKDARRTAVTQAATSGTATVAAAGDRATDLAGLPPEVWALIIGAAVLAAFISAWRYRDAIAAKIQNNAPVAARWLRAR